MWSWTIIHELPKGDVSNVIISLKKHGYGYFYIYMVTTYFVII